MKFLKTKLRQFSKFHKIKLSRSRYFLKFNNLNKNRNKLLSKFSNQDKTLYNSILSLRLNQIYI